MSRPVLSLVLLMMSVTAATEDSLVFGGASYHALWDTYTYKGDTKPLNELNPSLGFESGDFRWVLFQNSYYKPSVAYLWVPKWDLLDNVAYGPRLGLTTGYQNTPVDLMLAPVVGAELDFHYDKWHIIPALQVPLVFTLHVQMDY